MVTGILYARMGLLSVNPFLGVPAVMLPGIPIGIIAGAPLGFVAGTIFGALDGALLCARTYFYFLKGRDATAYQRVAGIGGASVAGAGLVAAWAVLGFETDSFVGGVPPGTIDGGLADVVLLEIGPIVGGAVRRKAGSRLVLSGPLIELALGASLPGAEEVGEIFAEAFLRAVAS